MKGMMQMIYFLGGGSQPKTFEIFESIVKDKNNYNQNILYVPYVRVCDDYTSCEEYIKQELMQLNYSSITTLPKKSIILTMNLIIFLLCILGEEMFLNF